MGLFKKKDEHKVEHITRTDAKKATPVSGMPKTFVILRPLVTEKASVMGGEGKYAFEIHPSAGRVEVKQEIHARYGIIPTKVNIQRSSGKRVRFGRFHGRRKQMKKAIVTLPKGKTIDVYAGV